MLVGGDEVIAFVLVNADVAHFFVFTNKDVAHLSTIMTAAFMDSNEGTERANQVQQN